MSKVLVLGASGKVGRKVVAALVDRGVPVKAVIHNKSLDSDEIDVVRMNFAEPESFTDAFDGVDKMFLLVPPMGSEAAERAIGKAWIDAAKKKNISHIVHLSSYGVEEEPVTSHFYIEKHLKESGIAYTFLQPNFFMQNFTTFHLDDVKAGEIRLYCGDNSEGQVSFVDTQDIAAVAAECFVNSTEHANKSYVLTGPEFLNHAEVAAIISEATGRSIEFIPQTEAEVCQAYLQQNASIGRLERFLLIYGRIGKNVYKPISHDIEHILGRPATSFKTFANDVASCWC